MTELLFRIVLPMGIMGGIVYLILLALRPATARLGPRMRKWGLVAVCLLMLAPLPFAASELAKGADLGAAEQTVRSAPTYLAGENLGEAIRYRPPPAQADPDANPTPAANPTNKTDPVTPAADPASPAPAALPSLSLARVLALLYLAGVAASVILFALRYGRLSVRLREDRGPADDRTLELYGELCAEMGMTERAPALFCSARVSTPLLAGVFRPTIYLPAHLQKEAALSLALRHELTHCRRGDLPLKLLVLAASAVQWYIPLCFLLRRDFTQACEEACDAEVSAALNGPQRQAYAVLLLEFSGKRMPGAAFTLSSPGKKMKERLGRLLRPAKPRRAVRAAGVVALCLLVAAGLLAGCTMAAGMGSKEETPADNSERSLLTVDGPGYQVNVLDQPLKWYREYYEDIQAGFDPADYGVPGTVGPFDDLEAKIKVQWVTPTITLSDGAEQQVPVPYLPLDIPVYAHLYGHPGNAVSPVPGAETGHWPNEHPVVQAEGRDTWKGAFFAPVGSPIVAVADGKVVEIRGKDLNGVGTEIYIAHSPTETTSYMGIDEVSVKVGQEVAQGEQIATIGEMPNSPVPHCYFMLLAGYHTYKPGVTPDEIAAMMTDEPSWSNYVGQPAEWWTLAFPVEYFNESSTCEEGAMEIITPPGEPVVAPGYGRVAQVGRNEEWGDYLIITMPSDWSVLYAFCRYVYVEEGDEVFLNQPIADVGYLHGGEERGIHLKLFIPGAGVGEPWPDTSGYFVPGTYLSLRESLGLQTPVIDTEYTSRFFGEDHNGVDLMAPPGTPIFAAQIGEVIEAEWDDSWGYYVRILHKDSGYTTIYAHCNELLVDVGYLVTQGQQIATVGDTGLVEGAQCHFEVWDPSFQPVDPADFIDLPAN